MYLMLVLGTTLFCDLFLGCCGLGDLSLLLLTPTQVTLLLLIFLFQGYVMLSFAIKRMFFEDGVHILYDVPKVH